MIKPTEPAGKREIELTKLGPSNITEADLIRLPKMVEWFAPSLLLKLLKPVIVSEIFGQYADRRLIEAALDPVAPEDFVRRARAGAIPSSDGSVWIDYVSDLGDGFDATYAIASLIAQESLVVGEASLPRAGALILGGDEVYPTSERDDYKVRMRLPYDLAWPVAKGEERTPMYVLPGNHDWYDGLVNFLAIFCRTKPTKIGGWKTLQRRSYFAAEIAPNWWIWGIDIALVRDMDQPQADYFVAIAKEMPNCANVILCSAEPGWYHAEANGASYRTLSYATSIARNANKDLRIPIVLSGDTHHYARYEGNGSQYITCGGGGAFLHGTLDLKSAIRADWLSNPKDELHLRSCYPSKETSKQLLAGNARFGALNSGLSWLLGAVYLVLTLLFRTLHPIDGLLLIFLTLLGAFWGYLKYQEKSWARTAVVAVAHSSAHGILVLALCAFAAGLGDKWPTMASWPLAAWVAILAFPALLLGRFIGGWIYGMSLWLGCRYFNISHNDAFSSLRLDSHRHFLRIKIAGDEATIYPIGLDKVPARNQWRRKSSHAPTDHPVFIAPLFPELIEAPIVIRAREATTTDDVRSAEDSNDGALAPHNPR